MEDQSQHEVDTHVVASESFPVVLGKPESFRPLLDAIGHAQFVLLGESTHGTREFYEERAAITKMLIEEKDFKVVALEADWAEMAAVQRYVSGESDDLDGCMDGVKDFPLWMWRNKVTMDLVRWVREHNDLVAIAQAEGAWDKDKVFWVGMDVRSVPEAVDEVIKYLEKVDPEYCEIVRERYSIFEPFRGAMDEYGREVVHGALKDRENEIRVNLETTLAEIQRYSREKWQWKGTPMEHLNAEQNAEVVVNGEEYYRKQISDWGGMVSWNTRDQHMVQTIMRLSSQAEGIFRSAFPPKMVLWAHNSHVGDARATDWGSAVDAAALSHELGVGQGWNLGHMMRETFGRQNVFIVGFGTSGGTVTAAPKWGRECHCYKLMPPVAGTQEDVMQQVANTLRRQGLPTDFMLLFAAPSGDKRLVQKCSVLGKALGSARTQRQIGVVYHAHTERRSHFAMVRLPSQVDCFIHINYTNAIRPMDLNKEWADSYAAGGEVQEPPPPPSTHPQPPTEASSSE